MPLRFQLFLVSLCLLLLPWGAWQYIKAVDEALRHVQAQSLTDVAQKISRELSAQPAMFAEPFTVQANAFDSLYAHPLNNKPVLDGYGDEWRNGPVQAYTLEHEQYQAEIQIGEQAQAVYFFIDVKDAEREYFNPLDNIPADTVLHDAIGISLYNPFGEASTYIVHTSAPGTALVHSIKNNERVLSNDIEAIWRESSGSYQLEFVIDKTLLQDSLDIIIYNGTGQIEKPLNTGRSGLAMLSQNLERALEKYQSPSQTVKLVNAHHWMIAEKKSNEFERHDKQSLYKDVPWVLEWLYRRLLSSDHFLLRKNNPFDSYREYPEFRESVARGVGLRWYRKNNKLLHHQTLVSVAAPIRYQQKVLAYVVLEKATDQLVAFTTSAFGMLLLYTVGVAIAVALILLLYASWLSIRIARLSRIATESISAQGSIHLQQHWPDLKHSDELGDLSRRYQQLLIRVQEYNEYLRTLSSKLSHELRTPIAVIRSSLENLEQAAGEHVYLQRAEQGVNRLSGILNAMSAASRLEESLQDAEFSETNMHDFLQELVLNYQHVYPDSCFELDSVDEQIKAWISQDAFIQMLDKLIDNAADFSPPTMPIILHLSHFNETHLKLDIKNTGPLLPESMQQSLFEPMVSIRQQSGNKDNPNLGLGLYIVRLIMELHHGDIFAKNLEDGSGVRFSLIFPKEIPVKHHAD